MYNFFYYFIYSFAKRKNPAPESYSAGLMMLLLVIHLSMVFGAIRFFVGWSLPIMHKEYLPNKILMLPIFFVLYWIIASYYERKSEKICEKYDRIYGRGKNKLYSLKNIVAVIGAFVIPLLVAIWLINSSYSR